jgi:FAD/FMN-containing dehydrogenase
MIVKCANAADVRLAVAFARENDLIVAVRGGGHNGAGLATCDDGMVIDFTQMKGVRFNPSSSTIRAESGCTQGDVNHWDRASVSPSRRASSLRPVSLD